MKKPSPIAFLYILFLVILLAGACLWCSADEQAGRLAMERLQNFAQWSSNIGESVVNGARDNFEQLRYVLAAVLAALFVYMLAALPFSRATSFRAVPVFMYCALALAALELIFAEWVHALYCLCAALPAAALYIHGDRTNTVSVPSTPQGASPEPFSIQELLILSSITALAIYLRFYALNRVMPYFEGEVSPYMVGATNLRGMLFANIGWNGPWSPLGYLYYLPINFTTAIFGINVLSIRFAAALISVLSVPLIYGLVRRLSGPPAAALAAAFVTLDPLQVGWGRSDVYPHGSTTWTSILICWTTVAAFARGSTGLMAACAFLMGLCWHQYPSGQFAWLIPFGYLMWTWLDRSQTSPPIRWKWSLLFIGSALWLWGFPMQYMLALGEWRYPNLLAMFGVRVSVSVDGGAHTLADRLAFMADLSYKNAADIVRGLYMEVPLLHFQDVLPPLSPALPNRTVGYLVAVGLAGALCLLPRLKNRREIAILPIWILAGSLPLILSDGPYPKRAATIYPAVMALSAIGLNALVGFMRDLFGFAGAWLMRSINVATLCLAFFVSNYCWFSGRYYSYGIPEEIPLARVIAKHLEPGTVAVLVVWNHYLQGKMTYLLLDALQDPARFPILWMHHGIGPSMEEIAHDPVGTAKGLLGYSLWYSWAPMRNQASELEKSHDFKKVLYIFQLHSWGNEIERISGLREIAKASCAEPREEIFELQNPPAKYVLLECTLQKRLSLLRDAD